MTKDIESIVAALFRTLPVTFEQRNVTAEAEVGLYQYVQYWVALGASRDKVIGRCQHLISRVRRRCNLTAEQEASATRVSTALLERCAHHYAGLSTLHTKR